MKTFVIVTLQIEGVHNWPDALANQPEVAFLQHPHRHIFHIRAKKKVKHDDRDIEIIMMKREMVNYLNRNFSSGNEVVASQLSLPTFCNFGARSCEMIARDLVEAFDLDTCEVLEDNENGAMVCK